MTHTRCEGVNRCQRRTTAIGRQPEPARPGLAAVETGRHTCPKHPQSPAPRDERSRCQRAAWPRGVRATRTPGEHAMRQQATEEGSDCAVTAWEVSLRAHRAMDSTPGKAQNLSFVDSHLGELLR
jgi:hypothetical protein